MTSGLDSMVMVLDLEKKLNTITNQHIPYETKMLARLGTNF